VKETFQTMGADLNSLERTVQRIKAKHVNTKRAKESVRSFVYRYFNEWRGTLAAGLGQDEGLATLDLELQDLLRCAQRRTALRDYRKSLKGAKKSLSALEVRAMLPSASPAPKALEGRYQRILEMLRQICPTASVSFEQGLEDLGILDRKSWRGTAVEFREALRESLDALAPDDEVTKQPGFKLEPDAKGPTMRQKAMFILRSRKLKDSQTKPLADAINTVEEAIGKFVRSVYGRSSAAVHSQVSREEAIRIRDYVALVLVELLEIKE
jgi:Predicted pPIWI-associating nuclease